MEGKGSRRFASHGMDSPVEHGGRGDHLSQDAGLGREWESVVHELLQQLKIVRTKNKTKVKR